MKAFKKLIEKVKKLSVPVKIQLVLALLCTMAIPVYAWFAYQDRIEALTKIKEPPSINLASGGDDQAVYISLENIDVTVGSEKYIVFSIEPGKYSAYDILASIEGSYEIDGCYVSTFSDGWIIVDHKPNNNIWTRNKEDYRIEYIAYDINGEIIRISD